LGTCVPDPHNPLKEFYSQRSKYISIIGDSHIETLALQVSTTYGDKYLHSSCYKSKWERGKEKEKKGQIMGKNR
jgi:hypothetical protein